MSVAPEYFHIGFTLPPTVSYEHVQEAIARLCLDWIRYAPNCYLVWTRSTARMLAGALMTVTIENFMILKVTDFSDGFACIPPWAWEWMKRDRSNPPPSVEMPPLLPRIGPPKS